MNVFVYKIFTLMFYGVYVIVFVTLRFTFTSDACLCLFLIAKCKFLLCV